MWSVDLNVMSCLGLSGEVYRLWSVDLNVMSCLGLSGEVYRFVCGLLTLM